MSMVLASILLAGFFLVSPGAAQDVPPGPGAAEVDNMTSDADPSTAFQIQLETESTFQRIGESSSARYKIVVRDASVEGSQFYATSVAVRCTPVDQTENATGWAFTHQPVPRVRHGAEVETEFMIQTGVRPSPEYFSVSFECTAGRPVNDVVGRFTLTAQAEEFTYLALSALKTIPQVRPDTEVDFPIRLQNSGSHIKRYFGSVQAPDGWTFASPPIVVLQPGESKELTITGVSPRDQLYYLSGSDSVIIKYYPDDQPGKTKTVFFPVTVKGLYLHPALIPLTLLTITLIGVLVFFAVLARRAVEERILGQPVPPWRIPVEREYLAQLMREDPDQYYIVRYYLMVEEHQSALLWFDAFKAATKKDRKRESKWFKVKRQQERKVIRLEKAHNKLVVKWDKDLDKPEQKAERQKRGLERKLRRKERKRQRKVNRKHKKRSKKLVKKHQKKVKKTTAKFEKKRDKQLRRLEKTNRKREKRGEEPLPLPDLEPPTFEEPQAGEPEVVPEAPLMESRYASRATRFEARAARKKERVLRKRERTINKDRRRVDDKSEKLRAKIPPEPETALYSDDQFIPEDQVIVEDDRPAIAKWLFLPTLEEQDQARRRRQIHRADLQRAKDAGDESRVEDLKSRYVEERKVRAVERKERIKGTLAQKKEEGRLAAERKRALKARQKAIERNEAPPQAAGHERGDETAPLPVRSRPLAPSEDFGPTRRRFKIGKRRPEAAPESEDDEAAKSPEQGQT